MLGKQEIKAKLRDGWTIHSGPSIASLRYIHNCNYQIPQDSPHCPYQMLHRVIMYTGCLAYMQCTLYIMTTTEKISAIGMYRDGPYNVK